MLIKCTNGSIPQKEIDVYVDQIKRNNPEKDIKAVEITLDGDFVSVKFEYDSIRIERIRRITGYLVGDLDRFNDAKYAEVMDRVKHSVHN
ncbi:MAG: hypothetical protein IJH40_10675 [Ruminococcus sp.]|uniref:anaerobic ribonucleoside-triphosphate reductase n=1 Tax=Ruminococcus sp. TaxID=41978 RepID=UPI0028739ADE|nr:anaerobic ribonucleoside-triphosphate reductase [Ruminococcus sp.]MBQ3286082.1 hypothetical protein [Ruminococcus sp.]MBQ9680303.1 hypothetical protein [Ruminococcus sp.]